MPVCRAYALATSNNLPHQARVDIVAAAGLSTTLYLKLTTVLWLLSQEKSSTINPLVSSVEEEALSRGCTYGKGDHAFARQLGPGMIWTGFGYEVEAWCRGSVQELEWR
jgi:hypothetical protein